MTVEESAFSKPKYVYVFISLKDEKFYIGFTANLNRRIKEHLAGNVPSTKNRLPLRFIYYECFLNEGDAKAREIFLKSGFGRDQLRKSLKRTLNPFRATMPINLKKEEI